jgi:hypothetical protein
LAVFVALFGESVKVIDATGGLFEEFVTADSTLACGA